MKMENKKFVIIDAFALAYKAYYAFMQRPLITKKGEPTSAVFGFLTQLFKIIEDNKPDYIAVAFDSKEKTFRHEKFENYKVSRSAMPDDMIPQVLRIKEIINAFRIPIYILPKWEADDIIGSAVCKAEKAGLDCIIVTPDKDLNQLVTDRVKVVRPGRKSDEVTIYDKEKIRTEFGFEPKQMVDYLALIGDSSDDIPGVKGIGEKTAIPLIVKYGSIENLYEHIDEIDKPSVKNKLIDGKANAFMSKELATIDCDMDLEFNFEEAKVKQPDFDKIREIFIELEFKTLFSRVLNIFAKHVEVPKEEVVEEKETELKFYDQNKVQYKLITQIGEAEELANELAKQDLFAFDTETNSLNIFKLKLAGISFAFNLDEGYFVAINPTESVDLFSTKKDDRLHAADFVRIFKDVLENKKIKKVCQNAKFDIAVLKNYDINVQGLYFDTMIASYVLDPDQKHGMDDLSEKYLSYKPISLISLLGMKKDSTKIFDVDLASLSCYSCEDADITFKLYHILSEQIKRNNLEKLAYEVEFPLVEVLEDMERTGINVDKNVLKLLSNDLQILLDNYTMNIYRCCGEEFNINSPQQLQKILFDKLNLKTGKKTKTGFSTDARSLEALLGEHEVIQLLMDYRQVSKLKTTYADSLPNLIEPKTGRIHTCFNQTVASTGRLSSNEPNLQNIPIRSELGKEIRKAFVPRDKDYVILSADYSQIELRILAAVSGDPALQQAFKEKEDIHTSTAALVFKVNRKEVTPDMRRRAKEVNFGILYGLGPFGLKTRLGITQGHAKEIIDTYFSTFSYVRAFMDNCIYKAQSKGFAETVLGRRRFLRNINSNNRVVKQFEERVAINMPIQGTAADMIKLAMINIFRELEKRKAKTKMVLQVHDELLFDAHKDEVDELKLVIKDIMETSLTLDVPIVAETGIGDNWLDAH
ncbi:MAG TPA: DNA polymerase I [Ignavibacteriaceae bacterium]|nr:DNA polymerase I [Ignavibacteriaceae bacterium]